MVWISVIEPEAADGRLARLYRQVAPDGQVDQILKAHSLRPHTMEGHLALYRSVLHHPHNTLDPAFAEALGVAVSLANGCAYCVTHHAAGLGRELADPRRHASWMQALREQRWTPAFDTRQALALDWAWTLTTHPRQCTQAQIDALREAGWRDGEILEINQIIAYFNYANRVVLGLGVTTDGEQPGRVHPAPETAR
ncbi:MAG: peroxidase-related enzyme [Wenzhouxiangellaceae bacterium]